MSKQPSKRESDKALELIEELAEVKPIVGHYGMLEGAECKICNRQLDAKWLRWFTCNTPDGDCLGAKARRFLKSKWAELHRKGK